LGNYDRGIIVFTLILFNLIFATLVSAYGNSVYADADKPIIKQEADTGFIIDAGINAVGLDEGDTNIVQYFWKGLTNVPPIVNAIQGALLVFTVLIVISLLKGG
jgi:hypothetical protein